MWIVVYAMFVAAVVYLGWLARHWSQQLKLEGERAPEPHPTP